MTPSLWEAGGDAAESGPAAGVDGRQLAGAPGAAIGRGFGAAARGGRGGSGAGGSMLAGIPPTPELLAKVDALPPANELPGVSQAGSRAADPHFTLRRLLRPIALALFIGLVLDGLDAVASIAMPALVRGGVDNGVLAKEFHPIVVVSLIGLAIVCADWVINVIQTNVVGRNGERMLYTLRVKIFSHLQRLGLDFYEREMSGRIMTRMTTDVDAMDTFLQTGLITMVNAVLTFVGVLVALLFINLRLGLIRWATTPLRRILGMCWWTSPNRLTSKISVTACALSVTVNRWEIPRSRLCSTAGRQLVRQGRNSINWWPSLQASSPMRTATCSLKPTTSSTLISPPCRATTR